MNSLWRQTRLQLQTKLRLYQTCILHGLEAWTLFCGISRPSICVASVWSLEYAGTILSETLRSSPPPIFPVSRTLSPRDETYCSVMCWYLIDLIDDHTPAHRAQSQVAAVRLVPALTPRLAPTPRQPAHRGYSRSATITHSEWSKASRRGHSGLTQRTSAVYAIRWWWWWWWWCQLMFTVITLNTQTPSAFSRITPPAVIWCQVCCAKCRSKPLG